MRTLFERERVHTGYWRTLAITAIGLIVAIGNARRRASASQAGAMGRRSWKWGRYMRGFVFGFENKHRMQPIHNVRFYVSIFRINKV